jgi:CBS domain containing-hemolysin-like protein
VADEDAAAEQEADEEPAEAEPMPIEMIMVPEVEAFHEPVPAKRIRRLASAFRCSELEDALATMRRTGAHVARVFDAEGNTTRVLFMEDIIEELVGEVQDATST